ncbi:MAG: F0F1 ATP synthase subunit alpha [Burkholderiales bacterium]|nr:MAG: F0F1 ATP synthase subunit alpha [Burkholderiales bacterium]
MTGDRGPTALLELVGLIGPATRSALDAIGAPLRASEVGIVTQVGGGIARVRGLPGIRYEELVIFDGGLQGIAFNLEPGDASVLLLGEAASLRAGSLAHAAGRIADTAVGEALLGRVVDALGRPLDDRGPVGAVERRPVEADAPRIIDRAPVVVPLATGIKVVDALVPIGRGQRELILGDRQTGKTAVAVDTILNQRESGVLCVYCAIGQRGTAVARVVQTLRQAGALDYTAVVVASGEDPPGLQYLTPYAATTIAEYFVERGRDTLVVYDDLTRHARAYRELSLLMRRPPGREAYPGDIFYLHARLLERASRLRTERGGGSLTALPIIETQAQDLSAYIPTNLISITDGQIYLSPELFNRGLLPAVEVGRSVSRTGGRTQLAALRAVAGPLRLAYAQFEELESFARFATRLDDATRSAIDRGRRVREALKQGEQSPLAPAEQVAVLYGVTHGAFDEVEIERVVDTCADVCAHLRDACGEIAARIDAGQALAAADWEALLDAVRRLATRARDRQPPAVAGLAAPGAARRPAA